MSRSPAARSPISRNPRGHFAGAQRVDLRPTVLSTVCQGSSDTVRFQQQQRYRRMRTVPSNVISTSNDRDQKALPNIEPAKRCRICIDLLPGVGRLLLGSAEGSHAFERRARALRLSAPHPTAIPLAVSRGRQQSSSSASRRFSHRSNGHLAGKRRHFMRQAQALGNSPSAES